MIDVDHEILVQENFAHSMLEMLPDTKRKEWLDDVYFHIYINKNDIFLHRKRLSLRKFFSIVGKRQSFFFFKELTFQARFHPGDNL